MITTNVMARGINVEQVTIVVNYDLPVNADGTRADCETYLHRIGITGMLTLLTHFFSEVLGYFITA